MLIDDLPDQQSIRRQQAAHLEQGIALAGAPLAPIGGVDVVDVHLDALDVRLAAGDLVDVGARVDVAP